MYITLVVPIGNSDGGMTAGTEVSMGTYPELSTARGTSQWTEAVFSLGSVTVSTSYGHMMNGGVVSIKQNT